MNSDAPFQPRPPAKASATRPTLLLLGGVLVFTLVVGFGYVFWLEPKLNVVAASQVPNLVMTPSFSTPMSFNGIDTPIIRKVEEAELSDSGMVIGVEVGGKARAYSTQAMSGMTHHVVNDLIGDVPVTVTYCDRNNCARAFSSEKRRKRLRVGVIGMAFGRMIVRTETGNYYQDTGEALSGVGPAISHARFPVTLTTWRAWREAHPDTDVYVGGIGPATEPGGAPNETNTDAGS